MAGKLFLATYATGMLKDHPHNPLSTTQAIAMSDIKDNKPGHRGRNQSDLELDPEKAKPSTEPSVDDLQIDMAQLFEQAVEQTRMALCVTDPHRPGNPIVYVNQAFMEITGYSREESLGRNCKFLQGPETDPKAIERIRQTLEDREVRVIELLNYRKDGTTFVNSLHVGPIYDEEGTLTHFYGSQWDVSEVIDNRARETVQRHVTAELQHRTRNLFGVFGALLRLTASEAVDKAELVSELSSRLDAMVRAHEASIGPGGTATGPSDLHALAEAILRPYRTASTGRIAMDGPVVILNPSTVVPLGLALHELATNALKHGAFSNTDGSVQIGWIRDGGEIVLTWEEHGGPPMPETSEVKRHGGTGSKLVPAMLRSAGGGIEMRPRPEGMAARIRLPVRDD